MAPVQSTDTGKLNQSFMLAINISVPHFKQYTLYMYMYRSSYRQPWRRTFVVFLSLCRKIPG